jgi:hypothetical protein
MSSRPGGRRTVRVGIAISSDRICGRVVGCSAPGPAGGSLWSRPLAPPPDPGTSWPDLDAALVDLRETLGGRSGTATIALLPPLAQARRIDLPRLRDHELRRVLARDARRYFVGAGEPQIVGALASPEPGRRTGWGRGQALGPVPVLGAAAPERLVEMIMAAGAAAGWRIDAIVPACAAWAAAPRELWPGLQRGGGRLVVIGQSSTDVLAVSRGRVLSIRRVPLGAHDTAQLAAALTELLVAGPPPPEGSARTDGPAPTNVPVAGAVAVAVAGEAAARVPVADALRVAGLSVLGNPPAPGAASACALAAAFAHRARGPDLVPERVHVRRRRTAARLATALAVAAALLLAAAGGLHLWGLQRELDAVMDRRAAIGGAVSDVLEIRGLLGDVARRLGALDDAATGALPWSAVIADLAEHLPRDAYITALRVHADTLLVEGVAGNAARAFAGLRGSGWIRDVAADGPIRRVLRDDLPAEERFSLRARAAAKALPATAPATAPVTMAPTPPGSQSATQPATEAVP